MNKKNIFSKEKLKKFTEFLIEDSKYYDLEQKELKEIKKNLRNKKNVILDIGCGTGRLSKPLSKKNQIVYSLDPNLNLKKILEKKRNIKFINSKVENYFPEENFNLIILAWPEIEPKFIKNIERLMNKKTKFILILPENESEYGKIINKVKPKKSFSKEAVKKEKFLKEFEKKLKLKIKKEISTKYTYPNYKKAYEITLKNFFYWYQEKLDKKEKDRLKEIIESCKKGEKIIFGEKINFYLFKKK